MGFLIRGVIALALSIGAYNLVATPALNWGSQTNANECVTTGKPMVNVTQKVVNDVDSGVAGNYWAFDDFNRHIQMWAQTDGTYCAIVTYKGHFTAVAGQTTPAGTGTLSGNEEGTIEGGYRASVTGTLLSSPLWDTRGSVGTTDYRCDISGNCPGAISWISQYFSRGNSDLKWWGWIYHGGKNGTWVNAVDGNSGNIK